MVYVVCVCVCGLNACVYSVNWVGVLYNVGIRVLWSVYVRNLTPTAPEDWRVSPKHVELKVHK